MCVNQHVAALAIGVAAVVARPLSAQIDYRNLDDGRPVPTEDAYAIERYAFELLAAYEYENGPAGGELHVVVPELSYGVFANTQVGIRLPFAALNSRGSTEWGIGGPRLSVLYNFNTEGRVLPALGLRADVTLPIGDFAGDEVELALKAIASRSWGRTRLHLNGSVAVGDQARRAELDADPDWSLSLAVDRTYLRRSLLAIGELRVLDAGPAAPTAVTAGLGVRYQLTPTLVLDAGASRRLTAHAGPDVGLTIGFSHVFALAGLLPGERP